MYVLFLLFIPFCLIVGDLYLLSVTSFFLYLIRGWDYYKKNNVFSYMDIWNLAFVYVVLSEILLSVNYLSVYGLETVRYILISNTLINIGFLINPKVNQNLKYLNLSAFRINGSVFFNILIVLALIFFFHKIGSALMAYEKSRGAVMRDAVGGGNLIGTLRNHIGSITPIVATYFFRYHFKYKYKIKYLIVLVLCILPQILWGTRYILLFSIVTPMVILFDNKMINTKTLVYIIIALISVVFTMRSIREDRYVEVKEYRYDNFSQEIASYGSNEGIVRGTVRIFDYTSGNGYSYGKESAFSLYFWMPRSLWTEKPTQLSYWFVRTYNPNVPRSYSAAYGFWGELLMDFGYLSLILYLPFGILMRKLEILKGIYLKNYSYNTVFYYALIPFFFFAVRSPQTAIIAIFWVYILYRVIGYIINKLKVN